MRDLFGGGLSEFLARPEVGVVQFAVHAVGHEEIEAPVVVQVLEAHRPGPVGSGESREAGGLQAAARARVYVEGIPHVLRGLRRVRPGDPPESPRIRAIVRWSFWWVVAAMSATNKSISPSLFTSPRSEPMDE